MLNFNIYNYGDNRRQISIIDRDVSDIKSIHVDVITGDEVIMLTFKDNTILKYDSASDRRENYIDYSYSLMDTEGIKKFLEFEPYGVPDFYNSASCQRAEYLRKELKRF